MNLRRLITRLLPVASLVILLLLPVPTSGVSAVTHAAPSPRGTSHGNPGLSEALAFLQAGASLRTSPAQSNAPCFVRRAAASGDTQVNCSAEDSDVVYDAQRDQSEPSVAVVGNKVVSAYNDSYLCCTSAPFGLIGYSVSHDNGQNYTDMGGVAGIWDFTTPRLVGGYSDPTLAADDAGNIWLSALVLDITQAWFDPTAVPLSGLAVWEMPAGQDTFHLVSIPVIAGPLTAGLADKDWLAVGTDANGQEHFYLTYTDYIGNSLTENLSQGSIILLDSTDAIHWRQTQLTSTVCEPASPGAVPVPAGNRLYVSLHKINPAACTTDPNVTAGQQEVLTIDVASAAVIGHSVIGSLHGAGEAVDPGCGGQQVIETAPGLEVRTSALSSATRDGNGTVYVVWQDRPGGLGGDNSNATRIYLSYTTDGAQTWSAPQVISGPVSASHMADRFQPAIASDTRGLHALWYERIPNPAGGPDVIRADKEDLTLAGPDGPPRILGDGETSLSTTPFPMQAGCYMGDYIQIASNGTNVTAVWTDARNAVTTLYDLDIYANTYAAPTAS